MLRRRPALHVSCFLKKRRTFALKAVMIDSSLFAESKMKATASAPVSHSGMEEKITSKNNTIEIEGVTDVLTKYRAKLREKNIFQDTISKPSHVTGDAHLLQQVKKTLENLSDATEDSPVSVEMETILKYITHRGLKIYISFFQGCSDVDEGDDKILLKALKTKPLPLNILQHMEVDEAIDKIIQQHKLNPNEIIIFSSHQNILSPSKNKNILTCRFG